MIDKAQLEDEKVLFQFNALSQVFSGTVKKVESDGSGFWIEAPMLIGHIQQENAWRPLIDTFEGEPVFFVPTTSLMYLIAAK
jgi:hypothetical protein